MLFFCLGWLQLIDGIDTCYGSRAVLHEGHVARFLGRSIIGSHRQLRFLL